MSVNLEAGQIVLIDWRGDGLPKEPNKRRPCIVVQDDSLFDPSFSNVLVVPIAESAAFLIPSLVVAIDPTKENGCTKRCYAVSYSIAVASKQRIERTTDSRITGEQLRHIRRQIAECIAVTHSTFD